MELKLTRPLAFFDLETTGINISIDRIVEIAILKVNIDGSKETRNQRINPTIPIPLQASLIHGIYDEDLKDCPTFSEVAHSYSQFLNNCDLAGYNSNKFDVPLLVEEFLRAGIEFEIKGRKFIDIQNIFHKMEQRNLSAAYKFYCKKELENAHSALADTEATYEILKSQLDLYQHAEFVDKQGKINFPIQNNVQALHDFTTSNFADLAGHIVFDDKGREMFNFGKNKGKLVEEVFNTEPQYYDWMMKSQFPHTTKKVITVIKLRGFNQGQTKIL